jgi:hypothetical protein
MVYSKSYIKTKYFHGKGSTKTHNNFNWTEQSIFKNSTNYKANKINSKLELIIKLTPDTFI